LPTYNKVWAASKYRYTPGKAGNEATSASKRARVSRAAVAAGGEEVSTRGSASGGSGWLMPAFCRDE
jgi:hypothetical protein